MNKEELLMKVYDEVIELRDKLGKTNLTEEQKLIIEKLKYMNYAIVKMN